MYIPSPTRYETDFDYRRMGASGLLLPPVSLGLWRNFGDGAPLEAQRDLVLTAFDNGITHFDLANNYGPPAGSAESNFGRILTSDLERHRDEIVISTKAGYLMNPSPYGEWGSRKYLISSLNNSLKRLGVEYVDIFYSHRFDPNTPLRETIGALKTAVDTGKALYVGISSYSAARTREALDIAAELGVTLSVHQPSYSLLNRWIEEPNSRGESVQSVCDEAGLGIVAFSPLAQGLLSTKYLDGKIPPNSRAAEGGSFDKAYLSERNLTAVRTLNEVAQERGQTLSQMAISWTLRNNVVSSAIIGARTTEQLLENIGAASHTSFTEEETLRIDQAAVDGELNLWASRSSEL